MTTYCLFIISRKLLEFVQASAFYYLVLYLIRVLFYFVQVIIIFYIVSRWSILLPAESSVLITEGLLNNYLRPVEVLELVKQGPSWSHFIGTPYIFIGIFMVVIGVSLLLGYFFFIPQEVLGELELILGEEEVILEEVIQYYLILRTTYVPLPKGFMPNLGQLVLTWLPEITLQNLIINATLNLELPLVLEISGLPYLGGDSVIGRVAFLPFRYKISYIRWLLPRVGDYYINRLIEIVRGYTYKLNVSIGCPLYNEFLYKYARHISILKAQVWSRLLNDRLNETYGFLIKLSLDSQNEEIINLLTRLRRDEIMIVSQIFPNIRFEHSLFSDHNSLKSLIKLNSHYSGVEILPLEQVNIFLRAPYAWNDSVTSMFVSHLDHLLEYKGSSLRASENFFLNRSRLNILVEIKAKYPMGPYCGIQTNFNKFEQDISLLGVGYLG